MMSQKNCTLINVTFLSILMISIMIKHYYFLLIKLSHDQSHINLVNELVPRECPIGFQFYNLSHKCDCSHVLQNFGYQPICTISSDGHNPLITITLPVTTLSHWIGVIEINNTAFAGILDGRNVIRIY